MDEQADEVEVSIVIPCLNEENTIGDVVEKAWQALRGMKVSGRSLSPIMAPPTVPLRLPGPGARGSWEWQ